jgi:hypothetical protein
VGRILVDASIVDLDGLTFERASMTPPVVSAFGKLSANSSTGAGEADHSTKVPRACGSPCKPSRTAIQ